MKNLISKLLILTIFLSINFFACKESPVEVEIEYTILPKSLSFNASGGEDTVTVFVKSPAIVESVKTLDTSLNSPKTIIIFTQKQNQ